MARIGHEAARIGEHTYHFAEQAHARKRVDLVGHALFLVEEPPGGAKLHFADDGAIVKITCHGGEQFVIAGVEVVDDGFGQLVGAVELI